MSVAALLALAKTGLGFLLKHWTWFAVVGLVIAVGVQSGRLNHAKADQHDPTSHRLWRDEAKDLARQRDALQSQAAADAVSISNLKASVSQQNQAITELARAGDEQTARANLALRSAKAQTQAAKARVSEILAAKAGADQCKSADEIILGSVG